jgi:hypothetical protein
VSSDQRDERVLDDVVARATTDRAFRQRLLADPHRAIRDAFGVSVPADFRIRFIERDPDVDALIVLPDLSGSPERAKAAADDEDGALSDEELDAVAGGQGGHMTWSRALPKGAAPRKPII